MFILAEALLLSDFASILHLFHILSTSLSTSLSLYLSLYLSLLLFLSFSLAFINGGQLFSE